MISPTTCAGRDVDVRLARGRRSRRSAASSRSKLSLCAGNARATSLAQQLEVVVEPQPHAGKRDLRAELRREGEVVPRQPQLPQQPGERAASSRPWA